MPGVPGVRRSLAGEWWAYVIAAKRYALFNRVGSGIVRWSALAEDYDRIRDHIEATIPGFADYNTRLRKPRGFHQTAFDWCERRQFSALRQRHPSYSARSPARRQHPNTARA